MRRGKKAIKKYSKLIKNSNFLRYLIAQAISVFGDVLFMIAITWIAIEKTNSIIPIAIMLIISYLPQLLVGIAGGYLIDRFDRKIIMVISDVVSFAALAVMFILSYRSDVSILLLYAARFILSLMDVFYGPASMAYLTKIVSADNLVKANSVLRALRESVGVMSAAGAGLLVAMLGMNSIFLINGITFLVAGLLVLSIPANGSIKQTKETNFNLKSVTKGFIYIKKDAFVRDFVVLVFMCNIVFCVIYNMPSAYAREVLQWDAQGYGYIQTAISSGAIAGGLVLSFLKFKRVGVLFAFSTIGAGTMLAVLGINTGIVLGVILYFVFSLTDILSIPCFTYLQLHVDDSIKGRVFAAFDTLVLMASPISAALIALFSGNLSVKEIYIYMGFSLVLIGLLGFTRKGLLNANITDYENINNEN